MCTCALKGQAPPAFDCVSPRTHPAPTFDASVQTVTDVLNECSSIDAAIKRLGELRLAASVIADAGTAAPGPGPGAAVAGSLLRSPPGGAACDSGPASGSGTPRGGPETAEQWVDFLVSEMATAKDMQDAKDKAAGCLQRFEAFVARMLKQQVCHRMRLHAKPLPTAGLCAGVASGCMTGVLSQQPPRPCTASCMFAIWVCTGPPVTADALEGPVWHARAGGGGGGGGGDTQGLGNKTTGFEVPDAPVSASRAVRWGPLLPPIPTPPIVTCLSPVPMRPCARAWHPAAAAAWR